VWRDAPPPRCIDSRHVLLIDDDRALLEWIGRDLRAAGFEVTTAPSADEALAHVAASQPDLILLDLHLTPRQADGLECLRIVRGRGFEGPVFIYSADDSLGCVHEAVVAGADGYLVKRIEGDLAAEVEALLAWSSDPRPCADGLDPAVAAYLRSRGLTPDEVLLAAEFCAGFEREKDIAVRLDRNPVAVWRQFSRIHAKLALANNNELAALLTSLSIAARRRAWNHAGEPQTNQAGPAEKSRVSGRPKWAHSTGRRNAAKQREE
jgi:DNA-binding response OmpR family regulator